jgi:hypothetical protein
MKIKIAVLVCYFLNCFVSFAQRSAGNSNEPQQVRVSDFGRLIMLFPDNYWENKKNQIIKQIGIDEFQKVKTYSARENIPCQMQLFCEDKDGSGKKNLDSLKKKQEKLIVYKIATFRHIDKNGINRGEYCILRVPYNENKTWDNTALWDTVYFVIRKDVVSNIN